MKILPVPASAALFAPFGTLLTGPARAGDRSLYNDLVAPVAGLHCQFHVNAVTASTLPLVIARMEHHPHAAQVFLPLQVARYLVTVMPADAAGQPDPTRTLCMIVPGHIGVAYRAGAWHAGVTALDHDAQFAVLMWRGAVDDDVFAPIPPLHVLDPRTEMTGAPA